MLTFVRFIAHIFAGRHRLRAQHWAISVLLIVIVSIWLVSVIYIAIGTAMTIVLLAVVVMLFLTPRYLRLRSARVKQRQLRHSGILDIDLMGGEEFEQRIAIYFRDHSWDVKLTPRSGDFGADLLLRSPEGKRFVAQLKRYSGSVGLSAVQEVLGARDVYQADSAMLITNSRVTPAAMRQAEISDVEIWDRTELVKRLSDRGPSEVVT